MAAARLAGINLGAFKQAWHLAGGDQQAYDSWHASEGQAEGQEKKNEGKGSLPSQQALIPASLRVT